MGFYYWYYNWYYSPYYYGLYWYWWYFGDSYYVWDYDFYYWYYNWYYSPYYYGLYWYWWYFGDSYYLWDWPEYPIDDKGHCLGTFEEDVCSRAERNVSYWKGMDHCSCEEVCDAYDSCSKFIHDDTGLCVLFSDDDCWLDLMEETYGWEM